MRSFRHQEFLRIAIADLAGNLELEEVGSELTRWPKLFCARRSRWPSHEVATRYRIRLTLKLCVARDGPVGRAQMSYNSDLDLIFVYHEPDEVPSDGREARNAVVQRLIAILEVLTREGFVYKIDLRLRPSGKSGPLVTSLDGFRDYHRQSPPYGAAGAGPARVIAGDRTLGREVERRRHEFVFGRGLEPRTSAKSPRCARAWKRKSAPKTRPA